MLELLLIEKQSYKFEKGYALYFMESANKNTYTVLGLMSGTSLDGLDLACCEFRKVEDHWDYKILKTQSIPYNDFWRDALKNAMRLNDFDLKELHLNYGTWLGKQSREFIEKSPQYIDLIASHGHTVFHQPEHGITLQIGSGQELANTSGYKVICDFRTKDVLLGGQGAPLVPIGDKYLFSDFNFCLNLGGISNISMSVEGKRIAFDICPVNMLFSYITQKINLPYDDEGILARSGTINYSLLEALNVLDFYKKQHPKSLGYEWFENKIIPLLDHTKDSIENLLRTAVEHISFQINAVVSRYLVRDTHSRLLITGGGVFNTFLIEKLTQKLGEKVEVVIPDSQLIEFKEALIFAFMGVLRDRNEINCLSSVTGAPQDSSSGVIFMPD